MNVCWKHDGQRLLVGGHVPAAALFDLNGKPGPTFPGHLHGVRNVAWSSAGQIATTDGNEVRIWDEQGQPKTIIMISEDEQPDLTPQYDRVTCLAWSPDGSQLAVGLSPKHSRSFARVFRADGVAVATLFGSGFVLHLAWSPDGKRLVLGSTGGIFVSSADGTSGSYPPGTVPLSHQDVTWGDDNRIVGWNGDGALRCWDGATLELLWTAVAHRDRGTATLDAGGRVVSHTGELEKLLTYLVERDHGRIEALTPAEFEKLRESVSR